MKKSGSLSQLPFGWFQFNPHLDPHAASKPIFTNLVQARDLCDVWRHFHSGRGNSPGPTPGGTSCLWHHGTIVKSMSIGLVGYSDHCIMSVVFVKKKTVKVHFGILTPSYCTKRFLKTPLNLCDETV